MTLQETYKMISDKTTEAGRQQAEFTKKLKGYQEEKAQAEAAKRAALESKDELAYKEACRAIADAEAGIEFNTICLQDVQKKKFATESDDTAIKSGLNRGIKDIYVEAINSIEKAFVDLLEASETAMKKFDSIDAMAQSWDESVMKDHSPRVSGYSANRSLTISQFAGLAKTRLNTLRTAKKSDPFFKEGN